MTKEEQAQELLKKYIDKKASPAEIAQVERWYASSQGEEMPPIEKERKEEIRMVMLQKLREQMESGPEVKKFNLPGFYQLGKVAAVLLLISAAGIAGWWLNNRAVDQEKLLTLSTSSGEKKKIVFADGSVVVLGPSARLLYPEKFKSRDRTISLTEGEAFFEISPDVNRPFMVKTSHDLYTKVLGTSFRIKAYGKSRLISVAVTTGKVAVGNAHQLFGTLVKGQQIAYDKIDERAEISYTPVKTFVNLRFENTSLQEVAEQLEQAYGIRISINNPALKTLKCSATFNTKQNPEEVLDIICSLHHLRFRISDDHKTFNLYRR